MKYKGLVIHSESVHIAILVWKFSLFHNCGVSTAPPELGLS